MFLLPVFFAATGLSARINGISGGAEWIICGGLLAIAVVGKLGGMGLAARAMGASWKDAWSLGALMNTRGLMELIVLNVGLDLGIPSPRVFTMIVLMALLTTMMTGPLLTWRLNRGDAGRRACGAGADYRRISSNRPPRILTWPKPAMARS